MLPEGVLSIAIGADFWQPQKYERKAEVINILTSTMSRPFYSDAKTAKNVS